LPITEVSAEISWKGWKNVALTSYFSELYNWLFTEPQFLKEDNFTSFTYFHIIAYSTEVR